MVFQLNPAGVVAGRSRARYAESARVGCNRQEISASRRASELEAALSGLLLAGSRHSYSNQFAREPAGATPKQVFRIEAYIDANWDKPIRVEELAAIGGTSTRSLFRTFDYAKAFGEPPSATGRRGRS